MSSHVGKIKKMFLKKGIKELDKKKKTCRGLVCEIIKNKTK